jgi:hypothetical protein
MKKILISVISLILLVLVSCGEKVEPKECWEITPECAYTSESSWFIGNENFIVCDLTENEIRMKMIELRTAAASYKSICKLTYRVKR